MEVVDRFRERLGLQENEVIIIDNSESAPDVVDLAQKYPYMYYVEGALKAYPVNYYRALWICWRQLHGAFYQSRILRPQVGIYPTLRQFAGGEGGVKRQVEALYKYLPRFGFEVNETDPDFAHVHAAQTSTGTAVYTNHGVYSWARRDAEAVRMNELIKENLCAARYTVAVSHMAPAEFEPRVGVKSIIIPNGVDPEEFDSIDPTPFLTKYKLPGPYFLWAKVVKNEVCDPTPAMLLARDMPDQLFVFTFIDGSPAWNMRVVGRLPFDEMKRALKGCSTLLATTKENFSVQILEAMSCAKPVLALDVGGAREAIVHKETGYLAKDQEDLLRGANYCLEHAERLGRSGRERVEKYYRWDTSIIPQITKVYRAVIADRVEEARNPLISVVITHYNMPQYLPEAIDSVLAQTFQDFEVVVVDDGSKGKEFKEVMKAYADDPRVKVFKQKNQGVAVARNRGIHEARGKYICSLDADDTIKPEFLAKLVPAINSNAGIGIAYCDFEMFGTSRGTVRMHEYKFDDLKHSNFIPCCNLFRKAAWERSGGYKEMIAWEDYELWLNVCKRGYVAKYVPRAYFNYRKKGEEGRDAAGHGREKEIRHQLESFHPDLFPVDISVVIPTYNHTHYLKDSIGSVLSQTLQSFEVIVVDDGSGNPEGVDRVVAEINDPRIRVVHHKENSGLSQARNTGVLESHGRYVLTLDADDKIKSTCLEKMFGVLESRSDVDIAYCDIELFGQVSKVLLTHEYDFDELLKQNLFCCTSLYRREVFDACGGYKTNMRYGWEDYDFWVEAGKRGHCGVRIPEPLFLYRRDRESMIVKSREHIQAMRNQLHDNHPELYYERRKPVGCCGRRHSVSYSRGNQGARQIASLALGPQVGELPLVEMRFMGTKYTQVLGPVTRARYEFLPGVVKFVDPRDAATLLSSRFFEQVVSDGVAGAEDASLVLAGSV